jgi:N-acyl homoserine lactone hydrolase
MNKIKLYIFHTGMVRVDQAIPLHEKNPLAVTGILRSKKKQMILPVSVYLIVHPKGNVLIDTGWDTKYAHERPTQLLGMVDKISAPIIEDNEGIDNKLAAIGLSSADIDHLFISHMDFDHTSGLRLVKDVHDIRTSEEEWNACNKLSLRYIDIWTGICDIKTFAYQQSGIGPVGMSYDVFGDGTLILVHTPGHSKGLFSVMICGTDEYIVLGNDAAYLPESFSKHIIPGFSVDNRLAEKSLEWLIECSNNPSCKGVFVNHDPTIKEQILEVNL